MRLTHSSSWLLSLATLVPAFGCAMPDDDADLAFRTSLADDDFGNAEDDVGPPVEIPECIVVTTQPSDPTGGGHEPADDEGDVGGDVGLPPRTSTSGDTGDTSDTGDTGFETHTAYDGGAGDDFGYPLDPAGAPLCPGENKKVTVDAPNPVAAAELCERYFGKCCESICDTYDAEPAGMCALDLDDSMVTDLTDINPNPSSGDYVCGCECEKGLVLGGGS